MKATIALFCLFSVVVGSTRADQVAITEDGKKVLLSDDGTWEYANGDTSEDPAAAEMPSECTHWLESEEDKMTGKTTVSSREVLIVGDEDQSEGLGIYMLQGSRDSIVLVLGVMGAGNCVDKGDKVNILFRDGSRMELASETDFNCDGRSVVYFGGIFGKKAKLRTLSQKQISTMRVWTSKSYVQRDFTTDHSEQFLRTLVCLQENQ